MIAKVIVDIPSKSVDFTFDYIIPTRLQSMIQVGMRVIVPFGPRTIQGYIMEITEQPDANIDIAKLKEIKEIQDIKPELTEELIKLTDWYNNYFVTKRISMLEVMLPSAIKAKYTKVFQLKMMKRFRNSYDSVLTVKVIMRIKKLNIMMIYPPSLLY